MRTLRYLAVTSAVALTVCLALGVVAWLDRQQARALVAPLTARAVGEVTHAGNGTATVRWAPPGGAERESTVELAGTAPPPGTGIEVAFDPAAPERALVPGAAVLADADRATGGLATSLTAALLVLGTLGWQVVTRRRALSRPGPDVAVRRVRVQRGLVSRSWLETEGGPARWVPVHFDPVLTTLPAPATVRFHGDPSTRRLVGASVAGVALAPSGPVARSEPLGRRTDNPRAPDAQTWSRTGSYGLLRRARTDLVLLVPAGLLGVLWTSVLGGGLATLAATTLLLAALAPVYAAARGSDPS